MCDNNIDTYTEIEGNFFFAPAALRGMGKEASSESLIKDLTAVLLYLCSMSQPEDLTLPPN